MKKVISAFLVLVIFFVTTCPTYAAEPRYANANVLNVTLSISSSGKATIVVRVSGNTTSAHMNMTTYIEKKVGNVWTRVDIGTVNDVWEYNTTSSNAIKNYATQLSSTGNYRAVTVFTLTGSTVEEITKTATATY